jgi:hypothetical protein
VCQINPVRQFMIPLAASKVLKTNENSGVLLIFFMVRFKTGDM